MKIGIVDLDTSHPAAWLPLERELGCEVVGLWDGGSVHPAGYAETFAQKHGVPKVFDSLEQMVGAVDGVIIHSCNWDTHIAKARPFIEAGKSVLIDKPLAGNLADLRQMQEWVEQGARIFGGSSLRFARELLEWQHLPQESRGDLHTALCGCAVDDFNYGIHAATLLCAAMGSGAEQVRYLGDGAQSRWEVRWSGNRTGWLVVGEQAGGWLPFYATLVTDRAVTYLKPDTSLLYRGLLEAVLPWFRGESCMPPCHFAALIEPELVSLAALQSRMCGGCWVALSEIDASYRYDGTAFAGKYRKQCYPNGG